MAVAKEQGAVITIEPRKPLAKRLAAPPGRSSRPLGYLDHATPSARSCGAPSRLLSKRCQKLPLGLVDPSRNVVAVVNHRNLHLLASPDHSKLLARRHLGMKERAVVDTLERLVDIAR
jgi:hypothetical protein